MRRHPVLLVVLPALAPALLWSGLAPAPQEACAADSWIFRPSRYTHDPETGERVSQYTRRQPAYVRTDPTYMQSGYRHSRSTLRGIGGSIDRRHTVETWGAGGCGCDSAGAAAAASASTGVEGESEGLGSSLIGTGNPLRT